MMSSLDYVCPTGHVGVSAQHRPLLPPTPRPCSSAGISEVRKLEDNENLRLTLESLQMPTVEYKDVNVDDYSRRRGGGKSEFSFFVIAHICNADFVLFLFFLALSMQILKPASFTGTSHYPLLLLVYVENA